ncbi:MAG: Hsp20/alpha crystallin family protein [Anaerolineae bacterium]
MAEKFDPVKEFMHLRDNITKTVGESLRTVTGVVSAYPALDVYETETDVVITTDSMVGLLPESIEVSMEDDMLTVTGETRNPLELPETAYLHRELRFGAFKREVRIPRKVKASEAKAAVKKGVLTITLPKVGEPASQIIGVTQAE